MHVHGPRAVFRFGRAIAQHLCSSAHTALAGFSISAAWDWETSGKFAEGCRSVRAPCRIFASFAATAARCDSLRCCDEHSSAWTGLRFQSCRSDPRPARAHEKARTGRALVGEQRRPPAHLAFCRPRRAGSFAASIPRRAACTSSGGAMASHAEKSVAADSRAPGLTWPMAGCAGVGGFGLT